MAATAVVDEDALAWARQAYARLKVQQEAAAQVATAPAPATAPSSAGTAAAVQAAPAGSPVSALADQSSASAGLGS
ncbi:MAG: signal recognition particle-docking protein FtsY, partial [Cyanobium sp.]